MLLVALSAWMVLVRPKPSTWFLFLFLAGLAAIFAGVDATVAASAFGYGPAVANALVMNVIQCFAVFAIAFGATVPNTGARWWQWAFWYVVTGVFGIIAFRLNVYPLEAWIRMGKLVFVPDADFSTGFLTVTVPTTIAALLVAVGYTVLPDNMHRQRVKWVLVGIVGLLISVQAFIFPLYSLPNVFTSSLRGWVLLAFEGLYVVSSAAIAYGVLNRDVIDTSLWINRTLTIGVLAALVSQLFPLSEMTFVRNLENSGAGQWTKIAFILALAFAIEQLRRNLNRFLDLVFFRARYRAKLGLADCAGAIATADSLKVLRKLLVDQVESTLSLQSAALFESDGTTWRRTRSKNWSAECLRELTVGDVIIAKLKHKRKPHRLNESDCGGAALPTGDFAPSLVIPMFSRGELVAMLFFGRHTNGAEIDSDEVGALEKVAASAPQAFDYVMLRTHPMLPRMLSF